MLNLNLFLCQKSFFFNVTVDENENLNHNVQNGTQNLISMESEELRVAHLQKEYLKMNRLTQKLVWHLVNMDNFDHKFGMFLIGILFGENRKKSFQKQGLSHKFAAEKTQFRTIVNKHLKAAEKLSLQEIRESPKSPNEIDNFNPSHFVNRRLGSYLYPPERAKKFQTMFENKKDKKTNDKSENPSENSGDSNFDIRANRGRRLKIDEGSSESSQNRQIGSGEMNQLQIKKQEKMLEEFVESSVLPKRFYHHWHFLKDKVSFYQTRLKDFYGQLSRLAFEKMKTERENFSPNENILGRFGQMRDAEIFSTRLDGERGKGYLGKRGNGNGRFAYQDEQLSLKRTNFSGKSFPYFRD